MRKYNTGEWGFALPPELPPSGFDDSPDSLMSHVSRPGCSQFGFPTAIGWSDRDKALRTSQPIIANTPAKDGERPQALKQTTNLRENINTPDSGTDYATLTRLMIQYMKEAISSGAVFTDSADHIGNGWRLFSWTHEAVYFYTQCSANLVSSILKCLANGSFDPDPYIERLLAAFKDHFRGASRCAQAQNHKLWSQRRRRSLIMP